MDGLIDLDRKTNEYLQVQGDIIPSWFLAKVDKEEDLRNLDETDLMVRVVAAEAESESLEGKKGVAHVITNRLKHPNKRLFDGYDIKSVILKPDAFESIKRLKNKVLNPRKYIPKKALEAAAEAVNAVYFGGEEDNTGGATYFHPVNFKSKYDPYWIKTKTIGNHNFYKDKD